MSDLQILLSLKNEHESCLSGDDVTVESKRLWWLLWHNFLRKQEEREREEKCGGKTSWGDVCTEDFVCKKNWKYGVKKHSYFYPVCHQESCVCLFFIFAAPNIHPGMACQIISY